VINDAELAAASRSLREVIAVASRGLVEREALVEVLVLAAVAGEHVLIIGPPGTAKSEAVRRIAQVLGSRYFEYLLGRFTEPNEIFGPVDLRKLREGVVETATAGMLPEAEFAFLDEVFLGSTAILNTLLGILNERTFRRGHTRLAVPLRLCIGASNAIPEDETLAAFADRFLARFFVEPLADSRLEELLESGWSLARGTAQPIGTEALELLGRAAHEVDLSPVRASMAHAVRVLRGSGVPVTDRRAVKIQSLVAAAAVLSGRKTASDADLWALVYAVPTPDGQRVAREQLRELLAKSESATLAAAAAEASLGPRARATRIAEAAQRILQARPSEGDAQTHAAWKLQLEGVAREIDAGFVSTELPDALKSVRAEIVAALQGAPSAQVGT